MAEQREDAPQPAPRRRNIVVGKAQGEWGDTLPGATPDAPIDAPIDEEVQAPRTATTHPPIIGIEEMPPDQDALRH